MNTHIAKKHFASILILLFYLFLATGSMESDHSPSPPPPIPEYKLVLINAPIPNVSDVKSWLDGIRIADESYFEWKIKPQMLNHIKISEITNETGDEKNYEAKIDFRVADGKGKGLKVKGNLYYWEDDNKDEKDLDNLHFSNFKVIEKTRIGNWGLDND